MASENQSADGFIKREKFVDGGNSSESGNKTKGRWNRTIPGKRVLFETQQQQEMSPSPQRSSENNLSYTKRKILAGNYSSHNNLTNAPHLVGKAKAEKTDTCNPVFSEHLLNTRVCHNEKSSFNKEYLKNCNGVHAREHLTVSEFGTDIQDIEHLYLNEDQIDRYAFPANVCANGDISALIFGDRDCAPPKNRIGNQGSVTNMNDRCYSTFSRRCDNDRDFFSGEIIYGDYNASSAAPVDEADSSLKRTLRNTDFIVPGSDIYSFSNKSLDSGLYSSSNKSPDSGLFSSSNNSPDSDVCSSSNKSPNSGLYSSLAKSPDSDIYTLQRTRTSCDAFGLPSPSVDTDTFSSSNPDFTLRKNDSANGFTLPNTYSNVPGIFNCNKYEDECKNSLTPSESSCSNSFWESLPESCDFFPPEIYPLSHQQSDYSPSDTSSVCSLNSAGSPPKKKPFRYVNSPPYENRERRSDSTPVGYPASAYRNYGRVDGSTPTGQTASYKRCGLEVTPKGQGKRTLSGKLTNDGDSLEKGSEERIGFLQTPDSEPRYREARRTSLGLPRRKSFPVSRDSAVTSRASTADQTPYAAPKTTGDRYKRTCLNLPNYRPWTLVTHNSEVGFIDSHCHLDFLFQREGYEGTYADYRKKQKDTFPESYEGCVAVFCNPYTFPKKSMWGKFLEEDGVWAAFGCHPHNANVYNDTFEEHLKEALAHPKVVALGEIGVDYSNRNNCTRERQHEVFRRQLKIAKEKSMPLVIHCRDANEDCMRILKEVIPRDHHIHLHCFTDTWSWAEKWLETFPNLLIGITNVVTFASATCVHEVVKNVPLDRLLLETDTPYFVPKYVSKKLRWSHPGLAIHVAAQIAVLRDISLDKVLKSVRTNTERMYGI